MAKIAPSRNIHFFFKFIYLQMVRMNDGEIERTSLLAG